MLLGQLAKGGMAELFLARANGLGGFERLLVIKRVLPELARDSEFVRMLLDEARIAATLQHSNIVQVFDVDMDDGEVFFVMEHLHGQHVADMVERATAQATKIPLENAIAIAVAVAAGLHYAHERWGADGQPLGIVHRDVAPNNVIVTFDGNVKLIDFGIAKATNKLSTTRFGLFKGKLPYASPEQIRCEAVDRRTDVYSLGVLLYELTTGHPLFVADNEFELLRLMADAIVPSPRLRDKAYPRDLERIVVKALARDPSERYQTAQALQRDLEVFAGKARLDLSAFSLSRLMATLFGDKLEHWIKAQQKGLTLEEHITQNTWSLTIDPRDPVEVAVVDTLEVEESTTSWSPDGGVKASTPPPQPRSVVAPSRRVLRALGAGTGVLAVVLITAAIVARLASSFVDNAPTPPVPVVLPSPPSTAEPAQVTAAPTKVPPPVSDRVAPVVEPVHHTPANLRAAPKKHAIKPPVARPTADRAATAPTPPTTPPAELDDATLDDINPRSIR